MTVSCRVVDQTLMLSVEGRFNFALHQSFRDHSINGLATPGGIKALQVNLSETQYLDSSALGMLLVLRDQALRQGVEKLSISGAKGSVLKVLEIAKFGKFFSLE